MDQDNGQIDNFSIDGELIENSSNLRIDWVPYEYDNQEKLYTQAYWAYFNKSIGFNVYPQYTNPMSISLIAFPDTNDLYDNETLYEYNFASRDDFEYIFDAEHGLIYINDEVVYTLQPEQQIYDRFMIRFEYNN